MYASVAELREEGVSQASCSDERLERLITEASAQIDRLTGWFFSPRTMTFALDGRGTPSLELPVPPIHIARLRVAGMDIATDAESLLVVGAPIGPGFDGARLSMRGRRVFPKGYGNITAEGRWGFTEPDGTSEGRTPSAVRRACMLLVLRAVAPLAHDASFDARSRWRILEERTRDQSYRLDSARDVRVLTGDPEVDGLLLPYLRPRPLGAS
ncbi:MAG: hypothetical protein IPI49_19735 [Myxococcales bacterium]|nr:hypothetical protein [Myxococcales bacterium]